MIFEEAGLSAWITDSLGTPLPEYQVTKNGDYNIECWIPSKEGDSFKIQWKAIGNPQPGLDLRGTPSLDGVRLTGAVQNSCYASVGQVREKSCEVVRTDEARIFEFGKRMLTDRNDGPQPDQSFLDNLNTIRLVLDWGISGPVLPRTVFNDIDDIGPIDERVVKKGHAGSVKLGRVIPVLAPMQSTFDPMVGISSKTFLFRYASQDWLKAREIIPCSPKPKSSSEEPKCRTKRSRSDSPEIIDIGDLETDDDEIVIVKHLVPVPNFPSKKRKIKDEKVL